MGRVRKKINFIVKNKLFKGIYGKAKHRQMPEINALDLNYVFVNDLNKLKNLAKVLCVIRKNPFFDKFVVYRTRWYTSDMRKVLKD